MPTPEEVKKLLQDFRPLQKQIGELVVSHSQLAFRKQEWDGVSWPARYPNQTDPKINIAGVVADLAAGGAIKERRKQDRPVLRDTGELFRSIAWRPISNTDIEVGSDLPYADLQQRGGISRQKVTRQVKKGLAAWLRKNRKFSSKVGFLFNIDELNTSVVGRQFVGRTDDLAKDIVSTVIRFFEKGTTRGTR